MSGSTPLILATLSSLFFAGTLLALLRSVKGPLAMHLDATATQTARLGTVFTLFLVPMMLVGGLLIDKWGAQPVLIAGALSAGLGLSGLAKSRAPRAAVPGVLLLSAGAAALLLAGFTLLPRALPLRTEIASASVGSVCFALGVLLAPTLTGWLERRSGFRGGLLYLALTCLTPAVFAAVLSTSDLATPPAHGVDWVLHQPALWLAAAALFLYLPLDRALGVWANGYLKDVGITARMAIVWLGMLWLLFLGSRILAGALIPRTDEAWWIVFLAGFTTVCLGNLVGNYGPTGGGLGLLLLGACLAPIFPALLGLVLRLFSGDAGTACGVVFAVAIAGNAILPSLLSPASERHAPRTAMRLSLGFTLPLAAAGLVLALWHY
ncbi:MAG TPA: MFS transporter [Gemmataceae bacterium]|nr:MFS transporter [Gemmataceae bacterium]